MKVLDLGCHFGHVFEGWFASEDDFQSQKARALVQCPLCGDTAIEKRLSAPRLNLGAQAAAVPAQPAATSAGAAHGTTPPRSLAQSPAAPSREALQAAWLKMSRHLLANTEDVGPRFAEEARRMHHGETETRGIRGQASLEEAVALREEGIDVLPLPLADAAKQTLQ